MSKIHRRKTPTVRIRDVFMGYRYPVVIQSMTDTPTSDIKRTLRQIIELIKAGAELVRITINDEPAMRAMPKIVTALRKKGYDTPIVGDFHYNGHLLLRKYPQSAKFLDKFRINPGNIGKGRIHDENFTSFIKVAIEQNKAVRIGVNWGSLDQELITRLMNANAKRKRPKSDKEVIYAAMVKSAIDSAKHAIKLGLRSSKLVLSVKMSDVQDTINVYRLLAKQCHYVLHLGLTEAGGGTYGITASTASLAVLLEEGIGDTIRISLTPQPNISRTLEVETCKALLQSMGRRYFSPSVTSCPGCGRTDSVYFQKLSQDISTYIQKKLPVWKKKYNGIEKLKIAVMGCVVNGPGESRHANIGISLPGSSEKPVCPVYINGRRTHTLKGKNVKKRFLTILENYIKSKFSS